MIFVSLSNCTARGDLSDMKCGY